MINKNPNIVERDIHGTFYLIDITENYLNDKCYLYQLNETGMFIWKQIDGDTDIKEIVRRLHIAIGQKIAFCELYEDVCEYLDVLSMEGFIDYGRDK